jgi:hypothetical protein
MPSKVQCGIRRMTQRSPSELLPAARPQRRRGGPRMSPGGLFAGTGPDGGDGPSRAPDVTKVPVWTPQ